jgi:alpha-ketoglutarate-dependent taurine dioxygenase
MEDLEHQDFIPKKSWAIRRKTIKPEAITISQEQLIRAVELWSGKPLPLMIQPAVDGVDLVAWARNNRKFLETHLWKHGGILFRGFDVKSVTEFEKFIRATSGELLEYSERSSPRNQVSGNIYTSTEYPADQSIFLHNENSYQHTFPLKIFFFCITPAHQGGETPIADCRKVFQRLDAKLRERFLRKGVMYVRNFGSGFGLPWQTVFQTTEKTVVEAYCRSADIEAEWKDNNCLRTRQVRPAVARHPRTGEMTWFNHATFFHVSTLEPMIREVLLAEFQEEDLPNNTCYGDGSPMEPSVLDALREAYLQEKMTFPWQGGDILMLDNMLTAHGREPFVGPRKVVVGMAEPFSHEDM